MLLCFCCSSLEATSNLGELRANVSATINGKISVASPYTWNRPWITRIPKIESLRHCQKSYIIPAKTETICDNNTLMSSNRFLRHIYLDSGRIFLDFAPGHGLVWSRPRVRAVKLLSCIYKHRIVSAISLQSNRNMFLLCIQLKSIVHCLEILSHYVTKQIRVHMQVKQQCVQDVFMCSPWDSRCICDVW